MRVAARSFRRQRWRQSQPSDDRQHNDKGYDADFIREEMEKRGGTAMTPTKRNRLLQLPVDAAIYALRNMVERCFNKLKNARRLATRYDKTADSYLGFIHIVAIRLWMREFVNAS